MLVIRSAVQMGRGCLSGNAVKVKERLTYVLEIWAAQKSVGATSQNWDGDLDTLVEWEVSLHMTVELELDGL